MDAGQNLGDDIVQLAADPLAFLFLRRQKLAGQMPQLFLLLARLFQQPAGMLFALPEVLFDGLPLERYGFSNDARPILSEPGFARTKFTLPDGETAIVIHLQ